MGAGPAPAGHGRYARQRRRHDGHGHCAPAAHGDRIDSATWTKTMPRNLADLLGQGEIGARCAVWEVDGPVRAEVSRGEPVREGV